MLPIFFSSSGVEYDFFGIGEFWGCKSRKNDFGLQFRFFYYERASLIGGLAVKTGESIVTVMTIKTQYPEDSPDVRQVSSPHVRAGIQDSLGFWIPRQGFRIPGTRFQPLSAELGFQSLVRFRILSAVFRIPKPRIPDSTSNNFPDCGIQIPQMFHRLSLHRSQQYSRERIHLFCEEISSFAQDYIKADDVNSLESH